MCSQAQRTILGISTFSRSFWKGKIFAKVVCGLFKRRVIGSFFFAERNINGMFTWIFRRTYWILKLDEMENVNSLYFEQDLDITFVRDVPNVKFPNKRIGWNSMATQDPKSRLRVIDCISGIAYVNNIVAKRTAKLAHLKK